MGTISYNTNSPLSWRLSSSVGSPIPYDVERLVNELKDLKKIKLDMTHHN